MMIVREPYSRYADILNLVFNLKILEYLTTLWLIKPDLIV